MITKENIYKLLNQKLKDSDIYVVDVIVKPGNKIFIYLDAFNNITIDDCAHISSWFNSTFNRDDEDYALEVSSAGLNSPFKVAQQYLKNKEKKIKVKTTEGKIIKGILKDFTDNNITITENTKIKGKTSTTEHILNLKDILETKLDLQFFK